MAPVHRDDDTKDEGAATGAPPTFWRDIGSPDGVALTPERLAIYLAELKVEFESGRRDAWRYALMLCRMTGAPPPDWAWHFVVDAVDEWYGMENSVRLDYRLCLHRGGQGRTRRLQSFHWTVGVVTREVERKHPGLRESAGELFWSKVALALEEGGAPPIGWEKARKMERAARQAESQWFAEDDGAVDVGDGMK